MRPAAEQRIEHHIANLVSLIQKNLKLLIRARASALIVILGPLFVIFLSGLAFDNTSLYAVRIGAHSPAYNDLSNSFLEKLAERQFRIVRYPSRELCVEGIRAGEIHTCMFFSPDFAIGQDGSNLIEFAVDYSQLNLVWTVLNVLSSGISARSLELSRNLTSVLLNALEFSRRETAARKADIISLTTLNDEIGRRAANIEAELAEIELGLDPEDFALGNLSSAKGKVKHWVDNSLDIARSSLRESLTFIDAAGELVKGSAAGAQVSDPLLEAMKKSVDDIGTLKERLDTTEGLVKSEFDGLSSVIDHVTGKITQTKAQLDVADSARVFTLDEIAVIHTLLDQALLNILTVQRTLNEVQAVLGAIEITDPELIVQPIQTTITPVVAERSYLNYLFPSLLALVIMFTAILLAPILIMLERNSPAYFRNFMAPTSDLVFIAAIFLTTFLVITVQVAVILSIASIFFTQLLASFAQVALSALLLIAIFSLLGMLVGYLFTTEETAILGAISLGSVMLFLSDVIIPLESMPAAFRALAQFNPLVVGAEVLRRTSLFGASLGDAALSMGMLALYAAGIGIVMLAVYYASKRHAFAKYLVRLGKQ